MVLSTCAVRNLRVLSIGSILDDEGFWCVKGSCEVSEDVGVTSIEERPDL